MNVGGCSSSFFAPGIYFSEAVCGLLKQISHDLKQVYVPPVRIHILLVCSSRPGICPFESYIRIGSRVLSVLVIVGEDLEDGGLSATFWSHALQSAVPVSVMNVFH